MGDAEDRGAGGWRWAARPPRAVRVLAVVVTAYFLLATGNPDRGTSTPVCVDGLREGDVTAVLGARDLPRAYVEPSCSAYDELTTGSSLAAELVAVPADADSACLTYEATRVTLPAALSDAVIVESWATTSANVFGIQYQLELPDEPGCRFSYDIAVSNRDSLAAGTASESRLDVTTDPLVIQRRIVFPQVQFCAGAAAEFVRGQYSCRDQWAVTLGGPS